LDPTQSLLGISRVFFHKNGSRRNRNRDNWEYWELKASFSQTLLAELVLFGHYLKKKKHINNDKNKLIFLL